jgi:hypothetical protein
MRKVTYGLPLFTLTQSACYVAYLNWIKRTELNWTELNWDQQQTKFDSEQSQKKKQEYKHYATQNTQTQKHSLRICIQREREGEEKETEVYSNFSIDSLQNCPLPITHSLSHKTFFEKEKEIKRGEVKR